MWLEWLMATVVVASVLAVGTVHVQSLLVIGTLAIAAGVLALVIYRRDVGTWPTTLPTAGVVALTAWTALQAVPLPAWLVAKVAPANALVWAQALEPFGEAGPRFHSISIDPGATWVEVLKGVVYVAMLLASTVVAYRRGAVFGVATVFVSALAAAMFSLLHGLTGMTRVFGLYEPLYFTGSWHMGPLLNPNHLAGYLNLGTLCGMGVLLMRKSKVPRWIVGLGVTFLIGVTVSSTSRGAVATLPLGMAIVVALLRDRRGRGAHDVVSRKWLGMLTAAVFAGGLGLAALGLTTTQWNGLLDKDISKLSILSWARPLLADHPWVGIGRGAFETVYPAYHPIVGHELWTHPENLLIQWAAEWGLPVSAAAALFFFWLVRPSRMGATRSAIAAGAVGGIYALVLQNFVDFSLEVPSVAIAVVVLIGSCWGDIARRGVERWDVDGTSLLAKVRSRLLLGREGPETHRPEEPGTRHHRRLGSQPFGRVKPYGVAIGFALLGASCIAMAGWRGMRTPLHDRLAFLAITKAPPLPKVQFRNMLRAAMLRHPGEAYLPLIGAERAWRAGDDDPIPYLQRVFTRATRYGRAHLLLAEILFARGAKNQALMELKFACRDEPWLASSAVGLAIRNTLKRDELARIVPDGPGGVWVLETLGAWMETRDPAVGRHFDETALARDPSQVAPRMRLAARLISALENRDHPECRSDADRRACADQIEGHARQIEAREPNTSRAAQLRARALIALGKTEEALKALATACDRVEDRLGCLQERLRVASLAHDEALVDSLLKQIVAAGCASAKKCADTHFWVGEFSLRRGNVGAAANSFQRSTVYDGGNAVAWGALGEAASKLGTSARAASAFQRAAELQPDNKLWAKRAQEEKQAAFRSLPGSLPPGASSLPQP